jgi:hypothetical protein
MTAREYWAKRFDEYPEADVIQFAEDYHNEKLKDAVIVDFRTKQPLLTAEIKFK